MELKIFALYVTFGLALFAFMNIKLLMGYLMP